MGDERATVRPVTLARLVEVAHLCNIETRSTSDIGNTLDVSHRRARETLLEALRINLIVEDTTDNDTEYETTEVGERFLNRVQQEDWGGVSDVLSVRSPHYGAFIEALDAVAPADLDAILDELESVTEFTPYSYNQTSVEVIGDWAERLGSIQRNAFTGKYYPVTQDDVPVNFPYALLAIYDDLEETAGVDQRQRYLSIPELREEFCERHQCVREAFDEALCRLSKQNVGKLELQGAPLDTGAKDAEWGIKEIELSGDDRLISTTQSTDRVMAGVEQFGKQYYYLAVHERNLTYEPASDTSQS
jgi:predicted transcriptional regulator